MRNGREEDDPHQDRKNYSGRRTTHTNEDVASDNQQFHWIVRQKGRGRRGVIIAVNSVLLLNVFGMSSVYYQHSKILNRNHQNLTNAYDDTAVPLHHPRFRLTDHDNNDNDSIIATTATDRNRNRNSNKIIISPRNSSKIINTLKTDTNDTTFTSLTTNTTGTVRPIAPTSILRTGNTTTTTTTTTDPTRPTACDWLEDIDTHNTTDIFYCGKNKCAYHSISSRRRSSSTSGGGSGDNNSSFLPRYGYLVSSDDGTTTLHQQQQGYILAQYLTQKFAIRHTLLEPPRRTDDSDDCNNQRPIDQDFTDRLNGATGGNRWLKQFQPDRPLVLQPIELLPEGFILFKCDTFVSKHAHQKRRQFATTPLRVDVDFYDWKERLRQDLQLTTSLLDSQEGHCLAWDFQVVFDTHHGGIIHVDLDRCYENMMKQEVPWQECKRKIIRFTAQLIQSQRPP